MNAAQLAEKKQSGQEAVVMPVKPEGAPQKGDRAWGTVASLLTFFVLVSYAYFYWKNVAPFWFHPEWSTDDSLQQIYPFHKAVNPNLFKGDLITLMMECYLAPLHYWLATGVTWLTQNPIMTGHWLMLLQIVLSAGFVFLAVKQVGGVAPAFFAVAWLFHTRNIMQRLTAGLPRGWSAPVLAAYLYFVLKGNHKAVLLTILCGCLLHPPSTLIVALSYGMLLLYRVVRRQTRAEYLKPFITFLCLSPVYMLVTWFVVQMPPEIGVMADYETASQMPEFLAKGRFPFIPFRDPIGDIKMFGFQAFVTRFYNPGYSIKFLIAPLALLLLGTFVVVGLFRKRVAVPAELWAYGLATMMVYFASREFAFKLYVPNRHLQFPLGFFFIVTVTLAAWRALYRGPKPKIHSHPQATTWRTSAFSLLGLLLVGTLVVVGSGTGLYGTANFNYSATKRGYVWKWALENTAPDALFAGEPTHIDGAQLFGQRTAFVTTETSHPFYDRYYQEMKRRIEIAMRAHYAQNLQELVDILEPEKIDYFVFERKRFYPEALATAYYFPPFEELVKQLTSRPVWAYAYRQLPIEVNIAEFPAMPFKDRYSAVVDLKKLKEYLASHPGFAESRPVVPGEKAVQAPVQSVKDFSHEFED